MSDTEKLAALLAIVEREADEDNCGATNEYAAGYKECGATILRRYQKEVLGQ